VISGIGIDIVETKRIASILERQPKFIDRVLTNNERIIFQTLTNQRKIEYLSGRFAAKEAFSKAYGTGIGRSLSFLDIEISTNRDGKPSIVKPLTNHVYLSISHSKEYAVAQVIIESLSS
jgi:holo-[acyl-carrier protein] synthase